MVDNAELKNIRSRPCRSLYPPTPHLMIIFALASTFKSNLHCIMFLPLLATLLMSLAEALPPTVSRHAPDFTADAVVNQDFKEIKLSDYKHKKYVVLFFCESHAYDQSQSSLGTGLTRLLVIRPIGLYICLPHGDHRIQ